MQCGGASTWTACSGPSDCGQPRLFSHKCVHLAALKQDESMVNGPGPHVTALSHVIRIPYWLAGMYVSVVRPSAFDGQHATKSKVQICRSLTPVCWCTVLSAGWVQGDQQILKVTCRYSALCTALKITPHMQQQAQNYNR
jgi:hypothetical protein